MEIIFNKGLHFKKIIECCKDLIPTGNLIFNKEGISLNSIDLNQTALITFKFNKSSFSKFKLPYESESIHIPISFERLHKILQTYNNSDIMIIKKKTNSDKLIFIFNNIESKKKITYNIPILNFEQIELDIPEEKNDDITEINIAPLTISDIIKNSSKFGEYIQIKTIKGIKENSNIIKFIIKDLEGDVEYIYEENNDDIKKIDISKEINVSYILSYLVKFVKFGSIADSLIITLSKNMPIIFYYIFPQGEIKLFLSPKIEE